MVFMHCVYPTDAFVKLSPVGHGLCMIEIVHKSVLYQLLPAMVRFLLETWIYNIVANKRYRLMLAHAAILCTSKVNWLVEDCPEWYGDDRQTADDR